MVESLSFLASLPEPSPSERVVVPQFFIPGNRNSSRKPLLLILMSKTASERWLRCLASIQQSVHPQSFDTWFRPTTSCHFDVARAVIEVPSPFFADWLSEHYTWLILKTIKQETSWQPQLEFRVQGSPTQIDPGPDPLPATPFDHPMESEPSKVRPKVEPVFALNPRYRFDQFLVAGCNEFSFAAAKTVAEAPGSTSFNPLVIYGGVGLGKTHLLQAIGHYCVENRTAERVVYVTAEKFFSDYLHAIQRQNTSEYIKIYRNADVLLIDDIQFYVRTEGCQRELIHTFNTLYQNQKQIILSSDRPPSILKGFEDRLISRFQWGLVTDIEAPDLETRMAILISKAEALDADLPIDVARIVAEQVRSNIRELEGALIRLLTFAAHTGSNLSVEIARRALRGLGRSVRPKKPTIEKVQKTIAGYFEIPLDQLVGSSRKKEIATARHVGMYLCKYLLDTPLKTIGTHFGNRDHSTVIHACRNVKRRSEEDSSFREIIAELQTQLLDDQAA